MSHVEIAVAQILRISGSALLFQKKICDDKNRKNFIERREVGGTDSTAQGGLKKYFGKRKYERPRGNTRAFISYHHCVLGGGRHGNDAGVLGAQRVSLLPRESRCTARHSTKRPDDQTVRVSG